MKAFRYIALIVALAIPSAAIAEHVSSSNAEPSCCASGGDCCPHCPRCPHAH